jgi:hypothetical protein
MLDADVVIREVEAPINNWCSSGHCAPKEFKRYGSKGVSEKTKFFHVCGNGINSIYCEPCLIVANYVGKNKRKL